MFYGSLLEELLGRTLTSLGFQYQPPYATFSKLLYTVRHGHGSLFLFAYFRFENVWLIRMVIWKHSGLLGLLYDCMLILWMIDHCSSVFKSVDLILINWCEEWQCPSMVMWSIFLFLFLVLDLDISNLRGAIMESMITRDGAKILIRRWHPKINILPTSVPQR